MQQDNIDYLSGEVQEILATPPSWVATWGTAVLASSFVLLVGFGFIFDYPEIVTGDLMLTTATPPQVVAAQKSERISELKVVNNLDVSAGDVLAVFPSNANYEDVLKLEQDLETVGNFELEKLRSYTPNKLLKVGELSQAYSNFVNAFELLPLDASGQIDYSIVAAIENDNAQLEQQMKALQNSIPSAYAELKALEQEKNNLAHQYAKTVDTTFSTLIFRANVAVEKKKAEIKQKEVEVERIKRDMTRSNMRKLEAQTKQKVGAGAAIYQLNQRLDELKKEIKQWKDDHLMLAPIDGKLQFFSDIKEGQLVERGEELFSVLPKGTEKKYLGKVRLPDDRSGKVRGKQGVNIKFNRYPFREFGTVPARVTKVYAVAKENAVYAEVELTAGLNTTLGRELDFTQAMTGKAEIVTNRRSFVGRLFEKIF